MGGKLQLAVLEKRDGAWIANHEKNLEEIEGQVDALEKSISEYKQLRPDAEADASPIDIHEELEPKKRSEPSTSP